MARIFPSNQDYGPFAFDDATTSPTEMYWYVERFGIFAGKQQLFGTQDFETGALEDGSLTDYLQTLTTDPDMSTATLFRETEGPYAGDLALRFTMGIVP